MTAVAFRVPGVPVAQGRPRATVGPGGHARVYDPKRSRSYKALVQAYAYEAMEGVPMLEGPLRVVVEAYWPSRKPPRKKTPRPEEWRPLSPDADNVGKAILDAMNGIVYEDDRTVVDLRVCKRRSAQGVPPRVEVFVEEISDSSLPPS